MKADKHDSPQAWVAKAKPDETREMCRNAHLPIESWRNPRCVNSAFIYVVTVEASCSHLTQNTSYNSQLQPVHLSETVQALTQTYSVKNLAKFIRGETLCHEEWESTDGTTKNKILCPLPTDNACAEVRLWDASGVVNPLSLPVWRIWCTGNTVAYKPQLAYGSLPAKQNIYCREKTKTFISVL